MAENGITATTVAQAIAATLDPTTPRETKEAAVSFIDSIKSGDVRFLADSGIQLIRADWPSGIRVSALGLLQHLVRMRWDDFSTPEKGNFANVIVSLIPEMADTHERAVRSPMAALVAEVVRQEGVALLHELLPSLISLSNKGPIQAELVAMLLTWLPEDITVHYEDLEGDRRKSLLRGLTASLPEIFPVLFTLLEKHFRAGVDEYGRQQFDIAKQHAATVLATLNAVNAYAEWAPVPDLSKYGLIHGCAFLLSSTEFRPLACKFFELVAQRKKPIGGSDPEFDSAMRNIFQILMNVSSAFLNRSNSGPIDQEELVFMEHICEGMVALGSTYMQCIGGDVTMTTLYLGQMLGYFQHFKFALHSQSLFFWLAVQKPGKEKKVISSIITDDIHSTILDMALQRMLKENDTPGATPSADGIELWSKDFDGKTDFSHYRSSLLELIRLIASQKPVLAVAIVSQRVDTLFKNFSHASSISYKDLALIESAQLGLEAVVNAIFDESVDKSVVFINCPSEIKHQLHSILEGLVQHLLSFTWTEPTLAEILGRYFTALGPYMRHFPDSIAGVINKLFELLTSLPIAFKDPSSSTARHARLQICSSFIRIAKAAEQSLVPFMKDIAERMDYLKGEGRILPGEHNLLGEAVLVMASSAGVQQQQEVLTWLLGPLSLQWRQTEWQDAYLADPLGLARLCADPKFMWSIFHSVTIFEKALKRSGAKKTSDSSTYLHPMSSHLSWILPPLLKLLRSVHYLWSQPIAQALNGELRAAMCMSHFEKASLQGESNYKQQKGQVTSANGSLIDMKKEEESNEVDIRNWLKGIRDSGYNVLGLSATLGDCFFRCLDSSSTALALMENVQSMEFRHIRQLIHSVIIPLVKSCPPDSWSAWLENLLHPLLLHCQQALTCSWSSLLHDGRAQVPDAFSNLSESDLTVEVMREKLLRDLTREVCSLLLVLASEALNSGLPSLDQLGHGNRMDASLQDLATLASSSILCFLLMHEGVAIPAMRICIEVFKWTDSEAVSKAASFCNYLVLLAISTNSLELKQFVARDLFYAIIQGLTLESNAITSDKLVSLCHAIYVYLPDRDPAPRQVLMSLPFFEEEKFTAFEASLAETSSVREQKLRIRSFLQTAAKDKLKALAVHGSKSAMTNVKVRDRGSTTDPGRNLEEDSVIGLAAIM